MLPIPSFNPANTPAGGQIAVPAQDPGARILFYNESFYNIKLDFLNGNQDILHAWEARWWNLDGDTDQIDWTIDSTLSVLSSPISFLMGTIYSAHEELPGTYPISLIRQANVGNVVSTVGGVASSVADDGRPAGNFTLETTPSGDTVSSAWIKNDGTAQLGSTAKAGQLHVTNPAGDDMVLTGDGIGIPTDLHRFMDTRTNQTFIGGIANGAGAGVALGGNDTFDVTIDSTGLALLLGNLTIPNTSAIQAKDAGGTARAVLSTTAGNVLILRALAGASGQVIQLQDETGTAQLVVNDVSPQVEAKNDVKVDGKLAVVGATSLDNGATATDGVGNVVFSNNTNLKWKDSGGTTRTVFQVTAANNVNFKAMAGASGQKILFIDETGATQLSVNDVAPQVTAANTFKANTIINGPTSTQAISTNGATINTAGLGAVRVNCTVASTGIILQAGTIDNQIIALRNVGTQSITFAASATSHVAQGASITLAALQSIILHWDASTSLWY